MSHAEVEGRIGNTYFFQRIDQVIACRQRLFEMADERCTALFKKKAKDNVRKVIKFIRKSGATRPPLARRWESALMNDAVYKFKRYEDAGLVYTGINTKKDSPCADASP